MTSRRFPHSSLGPARHCRAKNYTWKSRQSSANCSGSITRQDRPSGKRPSGTRPTVDRADVLLQFRVQAFAKPSGSGFGVSSQTRVAPGVYQRSEHCVAPVIEEGPLYPAHEGHLLSCCFSWPPCSPRQQYSTSDHCSTPLKARGDSQGS